MDNNPKLGLVNVDVYTKSGSLKILNGNEMFTESRNNGITEGQGDIQYSPTFPKRGYKYSLKGCTVHYFACSCSKI